MSFGNKLMQLLEEREISQKEFAATLNIAPTTLNGYIKDKRQPDFELVKKMAFALGISIDYLFDYNSSGLVLSSDELSLVLKFRRLDEKQQTIINNLINITVEENEKNLQKPVKEKRQ